METLVLPNIVNENKRERAVDELPQSAGGRTIMTTEPKFVPNEAVEIALSETSRLNVCLLYTSRSRFLSSPQCLG